MSGFLHNRHARRAISIPGVCLAFVLAISFAPLLFTLAALVDVGCARCWRTTRLLAMVVLALGIEVVAIIAAGALWLAIFGADAISTRRDRSGSTTVCSGGTPDRS